jgi:hypothetical protein
VPASLAARSRMRSRRRPSERGDDAGRHRATETVCVPDRNDELPDPQRGRLAELCRDEVVRLGAEDGEVRERVAANRVAQRSPVREDGRGSPRPRHDVRRGEQEAVGRDRHCAAGAVPHLQVRDGKREQLGHLSDHSRVRGKRLLVLRPGLRPFVGEAASGAARSWTLVVLESGSPLARGAQRPRPRRCHLRMSR